MSVAESSIAVEIARQELNSHRRAWIVPLGAHFRGGIDLSRPIEIEISYENVGNEPAIIPNSVTSILHTKLFSGPEAEFNRSTIDASTCPQIESADSGLIVYPRQLRAYSNTTLIPASVLNAEAVEGAKTLYVTGCISYITLGEIHHSQYCFYLRSTGRQDADVGDFFTCGSGNRAN